MALASLQEFRSPLPPAAHSGRFGEFGGQYVAETLMPALEELTSAWTEARADASYWQAVDALLVEYVGRPSRLYHARALSTTLDADIWLKREDLNHTGSHKINNCIGQIVLAKRMGKPRIIAETGAGQHGVATATVAALFGLPCEVYMGAEDVARQALNVERMRMLGTTVHAVTAGTRTLKDAMNEALRDWVTNVQTTYYLIGTVAGPHPYPWLVRELQAIIGAEARVQHQAATGVLPDALVACVGGGSNAAGLFAPFVDDATVAMFGVEAGGHGLASGKHAATITGGIVGVLHGSRSLVLAHAEGEMVGQIQEPHSISAGLDYPGIGPEHAHWHATGRVRYVARTDDEALAAMAQLAKAEGILCALESAHAFAALPEVVATMRARLRRRPRVIVGLSGRGDKDMVTIAAHRAQGGQP